MDLDPRSLIKGGLKLAERGLDEAYFATLLARSGVVGEELLQRSVPPQLNAPGSRLTLPQSGNPVDQLSPLGGAGQPDSLGIK